MSAPVFPLHNNKFDQCPCIIPATCWYRPACAFIRPARALTTWPNVAWMPYFDTQVQFLLGWYAAIILPCQGLITLAPLPQSISVWRTQACGALAAVVGLSQSVTGYASLCRGGGLAEEELSGGAVRAGLLPLLWQDNKRIYLLGGQGCVLIFLLPAKCFHCEISARVKPGFFFVFFFLPRMTKGGRPEWFIDGHEINRRNNCFNESFISWKYKALFAASPAWGLALL